MAWTPSFLHMAIRRSFYTEFGKWSCYRIHFTISYFLYSSSTISIQFPFSYMGLLCCFTRLGFHLVQLLARLFDQQATSVTNAVPLDTLLVLVPSLSRSPTSSDLLQKLLLLHPPSPYRIRLLFRAPHPLPLPCQPSPVFRQI